MLLRASGRRFFVRAFRRRLKLITRNGPPNGTRTVDYRLRSIFPQSTFVVVRSSSENRKRSTRRRPAILARRHLLNLNVSRRSECLRTAVADRSLKKKKQNRFIYLFFLNRSFNAPTSIDTTNVHRRDVVDREFGLPFLRFRRCVCVCVFFLYPSIFSDF